MGRLTPKLHVETPSKPYSGGRVLCKMLRRESCAAAASTRGCTWFAVSGRVFLVRFCYAVPALSSVTQVFHPLPLAESTILRAFECDFLRTKVCCFLVQIRTAALHHSQLNIRLATQCSALGRTLTPQRCVSA